MAAKTCMVQVHLVTGQTLIYPRDGSKLSAKEAQREASDHLKNDTVDRCTVVTTVMEVRR